MTRLVWWYTVCARVLEHLRFRVVAWSEDTWRRYNDGKAAR